MGTPVDAPRDGRVGTAGAGPTSRREHVYTALRAELAGGRVSPWERLAEERLAEQFRVSRTPVREALARLLADGLIEKRAGGLYLFIPTIRDLAHLYELRLTLELQGIRRAIEDPTVRHDAARLAVELDAWHALRQVPPDPDAGFVAADERFHTVLLDCSGNPALTAALVQVNQRIRGVRMYDHVTPDRMRTTVDEHVTIAELVLVGRLAAASDALHHHVGSSRDVVVERAAHALAMARTGHPDGQDAR